MAEVSRPPVTSTPVIENDKTMTRVWYRALQNLFRWVFNVQQIAQITTADIAASAVSVTSANAATQTAAYVQADVQSIATLANELKGDLNTHIAEFNTMKDLVNELKAQLNEFSAAITE